MLRFRLGSIPIHVHPSHLLVSAVLALQWLPRQVGPHQPRVPFFYDLVERVPRAVALYVLAWVVIVLLSVLLHELGHAVAYRLYGYRPSIDLVMLGGVTHTELTAPLAWHRRVIVTAAGPLTGLALGFACYFGAEPVGAASPLGGYFLGLAAGANFVWAVLNLLPVPPLDGGQITEAVAGRLFGPRRGLMVAHGIALLVAVAMVALGFATGNLLLVIFFGLFAFQSVRVLSEAWRAGDAGRGAQAASDSPQVQALGRARQALEAGRLDEARTVGLRLLDAPEGLPAPLASEVHHVLGWVALKQGKGRVALEHFSEVRTRRVEVRALAAAFSLAGEEPRAAELWELAWREGGDATVLHEYAGSLLRLGREPEALALPGVQPLAAWRCAERVPFIRGAYSEAARLAEAGLAHAPDADLAYDAACAYAQAGALDDAVRLLERASSLGFTDVAYARSDADLSALHAHPGFVAWAAAHASRAQA